MEDEKLVNIPTLKLPPYVGNFFYSLAVIILLFLTEIGLYTGSVAQLMPVSLLFQRRFGLVGVLHGLCSPALRREEWFLAQGRRRECKIGGAH